MVILSDTTQMTAYQEKLLASANQMAEMSAFKDKLFTLVAHDLRDPLAVLINLTELLEKEMRATEEEREIVREVGGHVRDTYRLMENLLEWYRSQTGEAVYRPSRWHLKASVEETIRTMKLRADTKGVAISSGLVGDHPVYADRDMLELVLRNLISNAIKFTPEGGLVQIGAAKEGESYAIWVKDTGVGVSSDAGRSLFKDIRTASSHGTDGEAGSGLGLYLSAKLISIHGGDIWYESVPGEGSTFYFTVKASSGEAEA
jgi:signal transduction histidine kinase